MIRSALVLFVALLLVACPPPQPAPPPPPDASDASPPPARDSGPTTPCQAGCAALANLGCNEGTPADCPTVLAHIESARMIRKPSDGKPLTCMDVAAVKTVSGAQAIGIACGLP